MEMPEPLHPRLVGLPNTELPGSFLSPETSKNWRIVFWDESDPDASFFIQADLERPGFYPRIDVMQDDFGDGVGYTREMRLADARLIVAAPKMLDVLRAFIVAYESEMNTDDDDIPDITYRLKTYKNALAVVRSLSPEPPTADTE